MSQLPYKILHELLTRHCQCTSVQLNMALHVGTARQPLDLMQLGVLKTEPDGIVHGDN